LPGYSDAARALLGSQIDFYLKKMYSKKGSATYQRKKMRAESTHSKKIENPGSGILLYLVYYTFTKIQQTQSVSPQIRIIDPNQVRENMEVHHHPNVEKKNFTEYFLEFLMIFLAVTMGFFAESLREYFGDREKENNYVHSLAEDLKKDTAALHYSIRRLSRDINAGDSMINLFAKNKLQQQDDNTILRLSVACALSVDIVFNDRTSSQLKSSGSMRLIKHKAVADSILQYWNNQIRLEQVHERFEAVRLEQRKIGFKTFNWYKDYYTQAKTATDPSLDNLQIKAISNQGALTEFINASSVLYNSGITQYKPILQLQLDLATKMIEMIQEEYHFENE
jgi:hypothetical protein